ncbi:MAG: hypothetical protein KC547_09860 [Anaerolineae bacterium]|nr:hypothetical protein [Anaerolineae bacterium]
MHPLFGYALEKLHAAEQTLATHPGRIQERLLASVEKGLGRIPVEALPNDLQALLSEIDAKLGSRSSQADESSTESVPYTIDDNTAVEIAWNVLELVDRAEAYYKDNHSSG